MRRAHGESRGKTPEYRAWANMLTRCRNPKFRQFADYGGRGITVCARWLRYENFLADMGRRPSQSHSLDRYPNGDGNYEPSNVRWATRSEQMKNRRMDFAGERNGRAVLTAKDAADIRRRAAAGEQRMEARARWNLRNRVYRRMTPEQRGELRKRRERERNKRLEAAGWVPVPFGQQGQVTRDCAAAGVRVSLGKDAYPWVKPWVLCAAPGDVAKLRSGRRSAAVRAALLAESLLREHDSKAT